MVAGRPEPPALCCLNSRPARNAPGSVANGPSASLRFGPGNRPDQRSLPFVATKKTPGAGLGAAACGPGRAQPESRVAKAVACRQRFASRQRGVVRLSGLGEGAPGSPSPQPSPLGREFAEQNLSRFEPLNHREETSNIQHPTSNVQGPSFGPLLDVGRSMLDVGCSPGSWKGRPASRLAHTPGAPGSRTCCRRFSVFSRERAGVRTSRTTGSRLVPLNPSPALKGTLSPSEGVRGPFVMPRFVGREKQPSDLLGLPIY